MLLTAQVARSLVHRLYAGLEEPLFLGACGLCAYLPLHPRLQPDRCPKSVYVRLNPTLTLTASLTDVPDGAAAHTKAQLQRLETHIR
jgi:hypothetical protein